MQLLNKIFLKIGSLNCRIYGALVRLQLRQCGHGFRATYPMTVFGGENIQIGDNFSSMGNDYLYANDGEMSIGNNCSMNTNVQIGASAGKICIGNNVLFGPNVVLRAADHGIKRSELIANQHHVRGFIIIEDDVWIASNVVILKNVRIGKGSVVAAGAVVNKDVELYSVVAGVPARKVSERA